jgi:hypothetical protein
VAGLFIKVDVDYWGHPKVVQAGVMAGVLYQQMVMYSMQHTTDGYVPSSALVLFGHARPRALLQKLEAVGLIERRTAGETAEKSRRTAGETAEKSRRTAGETAEKSRRTAGEQPENGWAIPGYLERYRSAAEVAELKEKRRSAGMQGGRPPANESPLSTTKRKAICFPDASTVRNLEVEVEVEVEVEEKSSSETSAARPTVSDDDDLAERIWSATGIARPGPTEGDRRTIAAATRNGWQPDQLLAKASKASLAEHDPLAYLRSALTDAANGTPPTERMTPTVTAMPGADWSQQWALMTGNQSSKANDMAKRAWHNSRQVRRYDTETNAKFAFRDAYLAAVEVSA